jgi:protein-L-isoaspartate(D-aspartate) O-methyltransferase
MTDYANARENMVENQLRPSHVEDPRILDAFRAVPREVFLPARLRGVAYQDEDIDLGNGQHLIEPLVLGRLLQASRPAPEEVALVVGCDTGYAAAVLSKLVATVFLLVPDAAAASPIETRLDEFGFDTIVVQPGQAAAGLPKEAPFNLILLAGSVVEPLPSLLSQLDEGGRLAAVVQSRRAGKITVTTRVGDAFGAVQPFDAWTPPIPELRPALAFDF